MKTSKLKPEVRRNVGMEAGQILHRLVRRCADDKKGPQPPYVSMTIFQPVRPASLGGLNVQVRAVTAQAQGRLSGLEDEFPSPEHILLDEFAHPVHARLEHSASSLLWTGLRNSACRV